MKNSPIPGNRFVDSLDGRRFDNPDAAGLALAIGALTNEMRTANLIAYLAIAEARGALDEATKELNTQVLARLGLTPTESTDER